MGAMLALHEASTIFRRPQTPVPEEGCAMLCSSLAMIMNHATDLEARGFEW
jgi:hypothetical protein